MEMDNHPVGIYDGICVPCRASGVPTIEIIMDTFAIQYIVISALFAAAVIFLVRRTRKSFTGKQACSKGCGCDFSEQPKKATY